jgi:hypothetical protein
MTHGHVTYEVDPKWESILPRIVALHQTGYERRKLAARARESGMTYAAIGKMFGVSIGRARQMVVHANHTKISPIEAYLKHPAYPWDDPGDKDYKWERKRQVYKDLIETLKTFK